MELYYESMHMKDSMLWYGSMVWYGSMLWYGSMRNLTASNWLRRLSIMYGWLGRHQETMLDPNWS